MELPTLSLGVLSSLMRNYTARATNDDLRHGESDAFLSGAMTMLDLIAETLVADFRGDLPVEFDAAREDLGRALDHLAATAATA